MNRLSVESELPNIIVITNIWCFVLSTQEIAAANNEENNKENKENDKPTIVCLGKINCLVMNSILLMYGLLDKCFFFYVDGPRQV